MEQEPDKVEVIDFFGEEFNKRSVPCSVGLLIILIVALANLFVMILYPRTNASIFISLIIIAGFVLYYSYILAKNPGKIRKFSISTEDIEIILPDVSPFRIHWPEFEKLEIRKKEFNYKPYCRYEFHFMYGDSDKVVNVSLLDFQKKNLDKILVSLKNFAKLMKKEFTAVKETNISNVILLENFKI
ncbi:MAG: hypothetical protein HWN81_23835 [Candidatus Lokiarchaeota archaeon]|nr:hypothetical protein [Candidatus Lokiarchaeota archaeon]